MSAERKIYRSGSKWEPIVGYVRAVMIGNTIHVSGTTATGENGEIVGVGDPYLQARQCILNIEKGLNAFGARLSDVIRTRMYVTDIEANWSEIGRAHAEFFGEAPPATSMVEVSRLIDPNMLVEIEADAYVED